MIDCSGARLLLSWKLPTYRPSEQAAGCVAPVPTEPARDRDVRSASRLPLYPSFNVTEGSVYPRCALPSSLLSADLH